MLDDTKAPDREPRPELDRHAICGAVQDMLGRPITLAEYKIVWNKATEWMDPHNVREDYLQ